MRNISRQFRKMGKAIGNFFGRVKKGSPIDIAILVCCVALVIVLTAILVLTARMDRAPAQQQSSSSSSDTQSVPDVSDTVLAPSDTTEPDSGSEPSSSSIDTSVYAGTLLPETADGGQTYVDETLFLGDSNTYRLASYGLTTWQNNLSAVGMGIQHVTSTACMYFEGSGAVYVPDAVKKMQPKRIIMTYGTNNTDWSTETFVKQYKNAIDAIQKKWPYADIIINAIPPVDASRSNASAQQKAIDSFNQGLLDLAKEEGYSFLRSTDALCGDSGYAKSGYTINDGLHLSETGAKALIDYVRTHTHDAPDSRPALTTIPKHLPTPEATFNPTGDDSSSSETGGAVKIQFYISKGADLGALSGTLTQSLAPGKLCDAVTLKLKENCKAQWGCTEGSIEKGLTIQDNGATQTLIFTVPPTKLEKIDVWVSITETQNTHEHQWGNWKNLLNNTHQGSCTVQDCMAISPIEAHEWGETNTIDGTHSCTKCGAAEKDPNWTPPTVPDTPSVPDSSAPTDPTPPTTPTDPSVPTDPTPPPTDPGTTDPGTPDPGTPADPTPPPEGGIPGA